MSKKLAFKHEQNISIDTKSWTPKVAFVLRGSNFQYSFLGLLGPEWARETPFRYFWGPEMSN